MYYNFKNRSLDEIFVTSDQHFGHQNVIKYSNRPFKIDESDLWQLTEYTDVMDQNTFIEFAEELAPQSIYHTDEMDEQLIANWNNTVHNGDVIFHLGDFGFHPQSKNLEIWNRLNGQKIALRGNHDKSHPMGPHGLQDLVEIQVENLSFTFCHYAMRMWNKAHFGAFHCYGHSHGTLPDLATSLSADVGVDAVAKRLGDANPVIQCIMPCDYRPISLREFLNWMRSKEFSPVDHHDRNRS